MHSIIIFGATYLFVLPILLLIYTWVSSNPHDRWLITIRSALAAAIAIGLVYAGNHYVLELRPYIQKNITALVSTPPTDNSFPSDHATISFTVAFLLLPFSLPLGIIGMVAAALVGAARVAAQLHWPIDIVGGMGIALVATSLAYLFFPGARKEKE